jgi:hypothetical protein
MRTVFVEPNQNIIDICQQEYGSCDHLVALHLANGFDEMPKTVVAGDAILIPDLKSKDFITTILQRNKPATHNELVLQEVHPGGINYMGIEIDFIVS